MLPTQKSIQHLGIPDMHQRCFATCITTIHIGTVGQQQGDQRTWHLTSFLGIQNRWIPREIWYQPEQVARVWLGKSLQHDKKYHENASSLIFPTQNWGPFFWCFWGNTQKTHITRGASPYQVSSMSHLPPGWHETFLVSFCHWYPGRGSMFNTPQRLKRRAGNNPHHFSSPQNILQIYFQICYWDAIISPSAWRVAIWKPTSYTSASFITWTPDWRYLPSCQFRFGKFCKLSPHTKKHVSQDKRD